MSLDLSQRRLAIQRLIEQHPERRSGGDHGVAIGVEAALQRDEAHGNRRRHEPRTAMPDCAAGCTLSGLPA